MCARTGLHLLNTHPSADSCSLTVGILPTDSFQIGPVYAIFIWLEFFKNESETCVYSVGHCVCEVESSKSIAGHC